MPFYELSNSLQGSPLRLKNMLKYLDYIFVLRPVLMVPVWTILLLGHHQGSRYGFSDRSLFWLFIFSTLFIGGVYLLNQIYGGDGRTSAAALEEVWHFERTRAEGKTDGAFLYVLS